MRSGIQNRRRPIRLYNREPCETKNEQTKTQDRQHRHFYVKGFDLLAQVFRRSAYHEPGNEYGKNDEYDHSVKASAHTTENHFADYHVHHRNHSAERCKRIVHSIYGATARVRRHRSKHCRARHAETHLLAFHVAARLHRCRTLVDSMQKRIAPRLSDINARDSHEAK